MEFFGNTQSFRGVNWADPRDNYNSGWVVPSGLEAFDNYNTVSSKADNILSEFQRLLDANTVRLPINVATVFESWWISYCAAIDKAVSKQMKVVLGFWESEAKTGRIENMDDFWKMWQVVTEQYAESPLVYFEVFNEPCGYTASEWTDIAAEFLVRFPSIPSYRVVVSGTGYNDHLARVGKDQRLQNCLLSLHIYPYWNTKATSSAAWRKEVVTRVAGYYSRAIISEFGSPMTTGLNYTGPIESNNNIAFMYGVPEQVREYMMGSIYWPGLRDGDSYSITLRESSGSSIALTVTNPSGVDRIRYGWASD